MTDRAITKFNEFKKMMNYFFLLILTKGEETYWPVS